MTIPPTVNARDGGIGSPVSGARRLIVQCPYCLRTHTHMEAPDGGRQRLADCYRGEYVMVFKGEPGWKEAEDA